MAITAIVPVKRLDLAKERLAGNISSGSRRKIMAAMFEDTLAAISRSRRVDRTVVVTNDRLIADIARSKAIEVLPDEPEDGHSAAVRFALKHLFGGDGATGESGKEAREIAVVLAADCPLLDPRELDRLLTALPSPFFIVVPDRHGAGTNALVLTPPDIVEPSFGPGSRARHEASAREKEIPCIVEEIPSIGLDLDTPGDLVAITTRLEASPPEVAPKTRKALGV